MGKLVLAVLVPAQRTAQVEEGEVGTHVVGGKSVAAGLVVAELAAQAAHVEDAAGPEIELGGKALPQIMVQHVAGGQRQGVVEAALQRGAHEGDGKVQGSESRAARDRGV